MSNKYLVVYMERETKIIDRYGQFDTREVTKKQQEVDTDYYVAFVDGTSEENKAEAEKLYNEKLKDDKVYTANLCIIVKSTDYTIDKRPEKILEKIEGDIIP